MPELDMKDRDPKSIQADLKVKFAEVLAEPEGVHSIDCVWRASYKCFEGSKSICYMLLSLLCGIPLALYWGCAFAMLSFCTVWEFVPALRCARLCMGLVQDLYSTFTRCALEPCCASLGAFFSNIHVTNSSR